MKRDETLRVLGSALVILGWFVVLNVNVYIGGLMSAVGDGLTIPWVVRHKAWDILVMFAFLHSVTVVKVAQGGLTGGGW